MAFTDIAKRRSPDHPMLGLYVHVPFCSAICNYCNFNRGLFDADLKTRYVEALVREIREAGLKACATGAAGAPSGPTRDAHVKTDVAQPFRAAVRADTIYFGGGTPWLLEPDEIARIIAAWDASCDVAAVRLCPLEAHLESVTEAGLPRVRCAGTN